MFEEELRDAVAVEPETLLRGLPGPLPSFLGKGEGPPCGWIRPKEPCRLGGRPGSLRQGQRGQTQNQELATERRSP